MTKRNFVTLGKSDPKFFEMLWGITKTGERAIPVQSLNVGTQAETVTFEVVPADSIQKPSLVKQVLEIIKVRNFLLMIVPLFFILTKNSDPLSASQPETLLWSFFALGVIFLSFNIHNDVADHTSGFDRVNIQIHQSRFSLAGYQQKL